MRKDQKHTPKYWVAHDKTTGDVFQSTMSKSREESVEKMTELYGYGWMSEDSIEVVLVELRAVLE